MKLPDGFQFAGVACGIKQSKKLDIALIACDRPAVAAGVYTQNIVRAASIDWNVAITPTDGLRAVIVNSGNANACTGAAGARNNQDMAIMTAQALQCDEQSVAVLSTGVIGVPLPMDKVKSGIASASVALGPGEEHFQSAATAITTTDQSSKTAHCVIDIDGQPVAIAAMAKGAGMIGPRMATMLAVVITDANVTPKVAQRALTAANAASFNRISVEGHMSTNDAVILMGSQRSSATIESEEQIATFTGALTATCIELAKKIPADGEGASHLLQIDVTGTQTDQQADQIARTVANSALVKTAITGNDPNWGRIVSAVGYAGVAVSANDISLKLNGAELFANGQPLAFDAPTVSRSIAESFETKIKLVVGTGSGSARHWTSDLTVDYVKFNSEYTT